MRLTHLIGTNFFGGPERQILTHAVRVREMGFEPQLISFHENGRANELLAEALRNGLACRELGSRSTFHPGVVTELAGALRSFGSDVLIGHGYKANVVGRLASWWCGIPFLAISRGWTAESPRIRLYESLDRFFLKLADMVVAVSEGQRRKVLACGVRPEKVRVIRNAIDLDSFPVRSVQSIRKEMCIPGEAVLVVTAGRLSPEKNHLGLVEAARHAIANNPDVWFVAFGEGFLRPEIEKAVSKAAIGNRFLLPGFRPDVRAIFHDADIFVLPSHTEGLPNVVLEAFACGKPVVATNVGGTPEVVRHGMDGLLVPSGDMKGMASAILELAKDEALRARMGRSGFEHVKAVFDFSSQTEAYVDVYSELLAKNPRVAEYKV